MARTPTKLVNAIMAGTSWLKSAFTGDPVIRGMPLTAGIEITNFCNLKCPECPSGSGMMTRSRGYMDPDLFMKIIAELKPYLYYLSLYFQGEPMLHPRFFSLLGRCKGIKTIVSTNGHFLSEENAEKIVKSQLHKLVVSLDGMDQSTYSAYRVNGDYERVRNGIKAVAEAKRKFNSPVKLEIQFLVNNQNEKQIPEVKRFARTMNADLKLKSMQILNSNDFDKWLPDLKKFRRYEKKNNEYIIKSTFPDRCARLWFNPVITWDGKVVPCCFDKDAEYIMGDLGVDSFRDIWHGPKYRSFRKSLYTGRYMTGICRNCTSGLREAAY